MNFRAATGDNQAGRTAENSPRGRTASTHSKGDLRAWNPGRPTGGFERRKGSTPCAKWAGRDPSARSLLRPHGNCSPPAARPIRRARPGPKVSATCGAGAPAAAPETRAYEARPVFFRERGGPAGSGRVGLLVLHPRGRGADEHDLLGPRPDALRSPAQAAARSSRRGAAALQIAGWPGKPLVSGAARRPTPTPTSFHAALRRCSASSTTSCGQRTGISPAKDRASAVSLDGLGDEAMRVAPRWGSTGAPPGSSPSSRLHPHRPRTGGRSWPSAAAVEARSFAHGAQRSG